MLLPMIPAPITTTLACFGRVSTEPASSVDGEGAIGRRLGEELPPPPLRALHLVERVDVEADHVRPFGLNSGCHLGHETVGPVDARSEQARHRPSPPAEVADGVADPDPKG